MLKITLYKNCILNETYANVFSLGKINNKTILERYLDTLPKKVYEIDSVYQELLGTLVFDYFIDMSNIYDFNYMKVETIEENVVKILRYCFIQKITLKNELVYLDYEEDMWSSYIDKVVGINESYLDASRIIDYENDFNLKVRALPFEYQGNKPLLHSSIIGIPSGWFFAILEIQYYTLDAQGNPTTRKVGNFLTQFTTFEANPSELIGYPLSHIIEKLNDTETNKSTYSFTYRNVVYKYEIGDIYIFPAQFNVDKFLNQATTIYGSINSMKFWELWAGSDFSLKELREETIANDFKIVSIGTLSSQIKINPNGNDFKIKLLFTATTSNIALYLNVNNQLIDITNDFKYTLPVSGINSEEMSLLKLQRELKEQEIQKDKDILASEFEIQRQASIEKIANSTRAHGLIDLITGVGARAAQFTGGVKEIFENAKIYVAKTDKLQANLDYINAPLYTTINGVFGNSSNFVNIIYGIRKFYKDTQNDDFVKKAINNMGFIAFEFINDIAKLRINDANYFINKSINYNVISFKTVSCYGSFVRNTALTLNSILESGVKIWYNENMQEDNYQVG